MKCINCGTELSETAAFCHKCGTPVAAAEPAPAPEPEAQADPVCPKCGTVLSPGQQFCHKCGAAAQGGAQPEAPATAPQPKRERQPLPKKAKAGLIVLAAAIVIAAAIVLPLELPRYSARAHDWMSYVSNEVLYVANERGDAVAFDQDDVSLSTVAPDGSISTVKQGNEDDGAYTLYMVRGREKVEIADDVVNHIISERGDIIVYFEKASDSFDTVRMMRYLTASDESQPVEARMPASAVSYTTLSPDGHSIAYISKMEGSDCETRCYVDGETSDIRGNCIPLGISNGGRYIYYLENDDGVYKLYVTDGKDATLLHEEEDAGVIPSYVIFNADMSQMLYSTDKGTYIADGGKESKLLDDRRANYPILPHNTLVSSGFVCYRCAVSSLYDKTYATDNGYCWLDRDGLHKIADGDSEQLSKRLDVMVFLRDDKLFVANPGRNGANSVKQLSGDEDSVYEFRLSLDGMHVYYTDENDTLWYVSTAKPQKTKLIAYSVDSYEMYFRAASSDLWFIADGDLLFVSTGGGAKKIVSDQITGIAYYPTTLRFSGASYDIDDDARAYDVYGPRGTGIELIIDAIDSAPPAAEAAAPVAEEAPVEEAY